MAHQNDDYFPRMGRVPTRDFESTKRKTNGVGVQVEETKICVVMVGLPARGKSLIAQKGILPRNYTVQAL